MSPKYVDVSLNKIQAFFNQAAARIEALKVGEKIPATVLADELAKQNGMTMPQLYPTLKFMLDELPKDQFIIKKGAHGGITRIAENPSEHQISNESND